jgi:uncharacterized protein YacL
MFNINKGIGKSAEFKGVKGNTIFILLGLFILNFMILMILQIMGLKFFPLVISTVCCFAISFGFLYWFVKKFGEHGFEKFMASKRQEKKIRSNNPTCFLQLSKDPSERN